MSDHRKRSVYPCWTGSRLLANTDESTSPSPLFRRGRCIARTSLQSSFQLIRRYTSTQIPRTCHAVWVYQIQIVRRLYVAMAMVIDLPETKLSSRTRGGVAQQRSRPRRAHRRHQRHIHTETCSRANRKERQIFAFNFVHFSWIAH